MEWGSFRFEDPAWLFAALLGPAVLLAAWLRERRPRGLLFPGLERLEGLRPTWRARLRHAPIALAALALVVAAVALARPQRGSTREDVSRRGVDIVVALDVSGSMAAQDFQPRNRLAVAQEVVGDFIRKRQNDRVGLVVFAGRSLTKVPPTTDTAVLLQQLDDVRLDMLPDGTAIGSGLATSLTRLRHSKAKSRVIVLVTDGVNNAGEIDPATAADLARGLDVRVYTVGVGRGGRVPVPAKVQDPFTGQVVEHIVQAEVPIDEDLLKRVADRTGGEFFKATDADSLRRIFARIDELEKTDIRQTVFRRYADIFSPLLVLATGLLLAAGVAFGAGLRVATR